jgi:predicted PurR-regulated permease PerM
MILKRFHFKYESLAALCAIGAVMFIVITPLVVIASLILREAVSLYGLFDTADQATYATTLQQVENFMRNIFPTFTLDIASVVQQAATFIVEHLLTFFAGTASTIFMFFIALITSFYFFKDGKYFTKRLVELSPLKDEDDTKIVSRIALAVRSVAMGIVLVAILQGIVSAVGFAIFGFERAILWGSLAAIGALIPGIGTTIVFIPAIVYLIYTGAYISAALLALWGVLAVGLIDNILGPYLMSRGNKLHPLLVLLSVLGGIAALGPVGFILGPVILNLFIVLIEIYNTYVIKQKRAQ